MKFLCLHYKGGTFFINPEYIAAYGPGARGSYVLIKGADADCLCDERAEQLTDMICRADGEFICSREELK